MIVDKESRLMKEYWLVTREVPATCDNVCLYAGPCHQGTDCGGFIKGDRKTWVCNCLCCKTL